MDTWMHRKEKINRNIDYYLSRPSDYVMCSYTLLIQTVMFHYQESTGLFIIRAIKTLAQKCCIRSFIVLMKSSSAAFPSPNKQACAVHSSVSSRMLFVLFQCQSAANKDGR